MQMSKQAQDWEAAKAAWLLTGAKTGVDLTVCRVTNVECVGILAQEPRHVIERHAGLTR